MAPPASSSEQLHFILVPLPAQGHIIPMIDIAKLLAAHGSTATLVTTPLNAARFSDAFLRARASGLDVRTLVIPFPSSRDLPTGCESLDSLPSPGLLRRFYAALDSLEAPLEARLLKAIHPPPSCVISDRCLPWTTRTARRFGVPRLVFHGMSCFALLGSHNVRVSGAHLVKRPETEAFEIPGMPVGVRISRAQLPGSLVAMPELDDIRGRMAEAESSAYGVVVNSFEEVEGGCVEEYRKVVNNRVWCIGPVSLCNRETRDKFERGNKASIDETKIGVRVGVELPVRWGEEERVGVLVGKEGVGSAIETLMGGGEEGEKRRMRSEELRAVANCKMENGGSAHRNISTLIRDVMEHQAQVRH
ncbi:UDP-glycosyltransferase 73D1 [Striga hermonthica]|uniref:UDP-glycosyltransferase 73D1 n=1 Tax=Striga hermonthica TaxID=68872 RepID=A0A9N7NHV6_STRHE|nr:UDP-glycosyltransferase 73D1 [Striga hermonthica]